MPKYGYTHVYVLRVFDYTFSQISDVLPSFPHFRIFVIIRVAGG